MKCYLCGFKNDNVAEVKKHYLDFHKVDPNNRFFKKLFNDSQNNVLVLVNVWDVKSFYQLRVLGSVAISLNITMLVGVLLLQLPKENLSP